jgi:hypothetical protein
VDLTRKIIYTICKIKSRRFHVSAIVSRYLNQEEKGLVFATDGAEKLSDD